MIYERKGELENNIKIYVESWLHVRERTAQDLALHDAYKKETNKK